LEYLLNILSVKNCCPVFLCTLITPGFLGVREYFRSLHVVNHVRFPGEKYGPMKKKSNQARIMNDAHMPYRGLMIWFMNDSLSRYIHFNNTLVECPCVATNSHFSSKYHWAPYPSHPNNTPSVFSSPTMPASCLPPLSYGDFSRSHKSPSCFLVA
jgi:hypothetical protein